MIDKAHKLPVVRQAQLLNLSRSSVYYEPKPVSEEDLRLMRRMDELHLDYPFAGARMLRDMLKLEGVNVGRKHVGTLIKKMGIEAIYRRSNTSRRNQAHRIYPCLLRDQVIERPNQVRAMDTTYIPMRRGFVYLCAVLDWATRRVLSWRDNVFAERLWKSVKYEEIYLHGYDTVSDVKQALTRYFDFYNRRRPHSSLDGKTPDTVYFNLTPLRAAA